MDMQRVVKIKIVLKSFFFKKNKYKKKVTIRPPKGTNTSEWVKCLWYSIAKSGLLSDLINISRSGVIPPIAPQREANLMSFFLEKEPENTAPNKPCETGSIKFLLIYLLKKAISEIFVLPL